MNSVRKFKVGRKKVEIINYKNFIRNEKNNLSFKKTAGRSEKAGPLYSYAYFYYNFSVSLGDEPEQKFFWRR